MEMTVVFLLFLWAHPKRHFDDFYPEHKWVGLRSLIYTLSADFQESPSSHLFLTHQTAHGFIIHLAALWLLNGHFAA